MVSGAPLACSQGLPPKMLSGHSRLPRALLLPSAGLSDVWGRSWVGVDATVRNLAIRLTARGY